MRATERQVIAEMGSLWRVLWVRGKDMGEIAFSRDLANQLSKTPLARRDQGSLGPQWAFLLPENKQQCLKQSLMGGTPCRHPTPPLQQQLSHQLFSRQRWSTPHLWQRCRLV